MDIGNSMWINTIFSICFTYFIKYFSLNAPEINSIYILFASRIQILTLNFSKRECWSSCVCDDTNGTFCTAVKINTIENFNRKKEVVINNHILFKLKIHVLCYLEMVKKCLLFFVNFQLMLLNYGKYQFEPKICRRK